MMNWQPGLTIEEIEKQAILAAMRFFHNKRSQVAEALGIAPRTLDYKMAKYIADEKAALEKRAERPQTDLRNYPQNKE